MAVFTVILVIAIAAGLIFLLWDERRARYDRCEVERLRRINRETWEVYRAARQIHEETRRAFDELIGEASGSSARPDNGTIGVAVKPRSSTSHRRDCRR